MYYIDPKNTNVLYGDNAARHPEPQHLYRQVSDTLRDTRATKKWVPNVYLFDPKFYRNHHSGEYSPIAGKGIKTEVQQAIEDCKEMLDGVSVQRGVIALNDCARFAVTLMRMLQDVGITGGIRNFESKTCAEASRLPPPRIGDYFLLDYGGAHHGITIVATGTGQFVGLEAHASKMIKTPEFHLYTSMGDFVTKNFPPEKRATGKIKLIPSTAGPGIISGQGLSLREMKAAPTHLEKLVRKKNSEQIFTRLQAPEDPRVTTYVPAIYVP